VSRRYVIDGEELLTAPQTGAILFGVSAQTVRRWAGNGRIPREAIVTTTQGRRYREPAIRTLAASIVAASTEDVPS
jgi:predicted site-specific integrase-resolvase